MDIGERAMVNVGLLIFFSVVFISHEYWIYAIVSLFFLFSIFIGAMRY